jgi:N-acetylglucosaminyldiphosphoundecaprenol N-acetyl-beta-D-mannosaminyltransferase
LRLLVTIPETVAGSELSRSMVELAEKKGYSIFLLGAAEGVAKKATQVLKESYPNLEIVGHYSGSPRREEERKIVNLINRKRPDILLVAYSAPSQELWIARNLNRFQKSVVAMGVGGTLDFIAGKTKRAPQWVQKSGLEWLYRLLQEPKKRLKRIYTAVVIFPWLIWKEKLRGDREVER